LFNVCRRNINQIRRYKSWKYVWQKRLKE
jgi:hypothetical protein